MTTRREMAERRKKVRQMMFDGYSKKQIIKALGLSKMQWYHCFPTCPTMIKKKEGEARFKQKHPDYWKEWYVDNKEYFREYARQYYQKCKELKERDALEVVFDIEITDEDWNNMQFLELRNKWITEKEDDDEEKEDDDE